MRFYVESYGCTMNYGEGDRLSRYMSELGHEPTDSIESADLVILNTCTVVETTEKHMIKRMGELRRSGKQVIITGCMAKAQPSRISIRLPGSLIIPPEEYHTFKDKVSEIYGCGNADIFGKPSGIIPIAQGCLGNCTYCITKFARGRLCSRDEEDILEEFRMMLDSGCKEILITAQDTACYGADNGKNLPGLIAKMLESEGDFRIRIGMMNPDLLDGISDGLIECMKDPRVYRFIHVPVQSGSDEILRRMNRRYTVKEFMTSVNKMRGAHPDISIATDMIVGFPGETDEDFRMSLDLMKKLRADTVNITRFSARPGTKAASMEQVHGRIIAERSSTMTSLKNEIEYDVNKGLIGRKTSVLVTEKGINGSVITRTPNYRPVTLNEDLEIGSFVNVEISDCKSTYLIGRRY